MIENMSNKDFFFERIMTIHAKLAVAQIPKGREYVCMQC